MLVKALASTFVLLGCLSMHTAAEFEKSLVGLKTVTVSVEISGGVAPHNREVIASRLRTVVELRLQKEGFTLAPSDAPPTEAVVELTATCGRATMGRESPVGWAFFIELSVSQGCRLLRNDLLVWGETWSRGKLAIVGEHFLMELETVTRQHLDEFVNTFMASERQAKQSKAKPKGKTD